MLRPVKVELVTPEKQQHDVCDTTPVKLAVKRRRIVRKQHWQPDKPPDLTEAHVSELHAALAKVSHGLQNPERKEHEVATVCAICFRKKHTCAWETRAAGQESVLTGSQCLSCSGACRFLKITRSVPVLQSASQTLALVRCWSEFFSEKKKSRGGFADNCNCSACKRKATENK